MKIINLYKHTLFLFAVFHCNASLKAQYYAPLDFDLSTIGIVDSVELYEFVLRDTIVNRTILDSYGFITRIKRSNENMYRMNTYTDGQLFFSMEIEMESDCYKVRSESLSRQNLLIPHSDKMIRLAKKLMVYGDFKDMKELQRLSMKERGYSIAPFLGTMLFWIGITNNPRLELATKVKAFEDYSICRQR
jgi:hypothetical protein